MRLLNAISSGTNVLCEHENTNIFSKFKDNHYFLNQVKPLKKLQVSDNLSDILFLDIETVSEYSEMEECPDIFQELWAKKAAAIAKSPEDNPSALYEAKAGIFAEFAKVICISVGYIAKAGEFRIKSFSGHDEKLLLNDFCNMMDQHFRNPEKYKLCGHNIREFDIPFICRRLTKHGIKLPNMLNTSGKKPWELSFIIDTMDLWRFGDFKNYTSLNLLAAVLEIPSPKDDIDGSMVGQVYWKEKALDRIVKYCEKDVLTSARVYLKLSGHLSVQLSAPEEK